MIHHASCLEEIRSILQGASYDHVLVPCRKLADLLKVPSGCVVTPFHVPHSLTSFCSLLTFLHKKNQSPQSFNIKFSLWLRSWFGFWPDRGGGGFKGLLDQVRTHWKGPSFPQEAMALAQKIVRKRGWTKAVVILPTQTALTIVGDLDCDGIVFQAKAEPKGVVISLEQGSLHGQMAALLKGEEKWLWSFPLPCRRQALRNQRLLAGGTMTKDSLLLSLGSEIQRLAGQWQAYQEFQDFFGLLYHPWILKAYPEALRLALRLQAAQKAQRESRQRVWSAFLKKKILFGLAPFLALLQSTTPPTFAQWREGFLACLVRFVPVHHWDKRSRRWAQKIPPLPIPLKSQDFACAWEFFWATQEDSKDGMAYEPWLRSCWKGPWVVLQETEDALWPGLQAQTQGKLNDGEDAAPLKRSLKWPLFEPTLSRLSLSNLSLFQKDPDLFYRRCVLKLKNPAHSPDQRWGLAVHGLLESFMTLCPPQENFSKSRLETVILSLVPRFFIDLPPLRDRLLRDMIMDFVDKEWAQRQWEPYVSWLEVAGRKTFVFPEGELTLVARADRVDRMSDGSWMIWDYKTGSLPSFKSLETLREPQLPLETLMWSQGGFSPLVGPVRGVGFWHLSLKTGCVVKTYPHSGAELLARMAPCVEGLLRPFVQGRYLKQEGAEKEFRACQA